MLRQAKLRDLEHMSFRTHAFTRPRLATPDDAIDLMPANALPQNKIEKPWLHIFVREWPPVQSFSCDLATLPNFAILLKKPAFPAFPAFPEDMSRMSWPTLHVSRESWNSWNSWKSWFFQ